MLEKIATRWGAEIFDSTESMFWRILLMIGGAFYAGRMGRSDEEAPTPEDAIFAAIRTLISSLGQAEKETLLVELIKSIRAIPTPRGGELLSTIIKTIPRDQEWSVSFIKRKIEKSRVEATDKEIYNAIGYLTRKKHIRRIGYGKYIFQGAAFTTTDDLGGQPSITEGDLDD